MPSFNIESILSELDSLPSMPNAVNVQSSPQQNNNNLKSGDDRDESYNKDDTKSIPSKRMIIFDWDDTLFPTTHFVTNARPITIQNLREWGSKTYKLIKLYIDIFGGNNIYIITNGIQGWIEYSLFSSSQLFQALSNAKNNDKELEKEANEINYFDEMYKLINMHGIRTISSQFSYSNFYPNDPKKWKECTFIDWAIHHFDIENNDNAQGIILSIGDSSDEWVAAEDCKKFLENPGSSGSASKFDLQRIKLSNKPNLEHLMMEWDVLISIADNLKEIKTSFDEMNVYSLSLLSERDSSDTSESETESDPDTPRDVVHVDDKKKFD